MEIQFKNENLNLKKRLNEFLEGSTAHGIPNIAKAKSMKHKLFWSFFFCISGSFCMVLIFQAITSYLEFEVVTKIRIFSEVQSEFPAIRICNANPFTTNYSADFLKKNLPINISNYSIENLEILNLFFKESNIDVKHTFLHHASSLNDSQKIKLGHLLDDFILSCTFNSKECDKRNDFSWNYNFKYGNCYRFNSAKNMNGSKIPLKILTSYGIQSALNLKIFLGQETGSLNIYDSLGGFVSIYNGSIESENSKLIGISAGSQTNLVIKRSYIKKLEKPFSECEANLVPEKYNSIVYKNSFINNQTYLKEKCMILCQDKFIANNCSCYRHESNKFRAEKKCSSAEDSKCIFLYKYSVNFEIECENECPKECETIQFDYQISENNFPSLLYLKYLQKNPTIKSKLGENITNEKIQNSIANLNIFFEDNQITKIEEIAKMSFIDLLAVIGGYFGLFIGTSVLSFVEILEIIFFLLQAIYKKQFY